MWNISVVFLPLYFLSILFFLDCLFKLFPEITHISVPRFIGAAALSLC
jgi:hypothetical protein